MITETISHAEALLHFLNAISRSGVFFKIVSFVILGMGIFLFFAMIILAINKRSPGIFFGLSLNLPGILGIFLSGYQLAIFIPKLMLHSDDFQIETPQLYFDIFAGALPLFLGGLTSLCLYICYGISLAFLSLAAKRGSQTP